MKTDYPELEDRKVGVSEYNQPQTVIGCNFDVGITIVDKNGNESFCLNGQSSPHWKAYTEAYPLYEKVYKALFYSIVAMIRKGYVSDEIIYKLLGESKPYYGGDPRCAYK